MTIQILHGDCRDILKTLGSESVHCVVTSPPYWGLRDYGMAGQIGLEATPEDYTDELVAIFRELRRVLRADGTVWLNLGDSYSGSGKGGNPDPNSSKQATNKGSQTVGVLYGKIGETARQVAVTNVTRKVFTRSGSGRADGIVDNRGQRNRDGVSAPGIPAKNLIGIPWRVAFALQSDGWILRQDIIWSKPNPMPESVIDRCTKAHEYLFLLSKSERYYYDQDAISEPVALSTVERVSQSTLDQQEGSRRVPGKTNGPMKAVVRSRDSWKGSTFDGSRDLKVPHPYRAPRFGGSKYGDNDAAEHRTKSGNDYDIKDGRRNRRSVWEVATQPFAEAHFATFPPAFVEPCILAGCPEGGTVLDPFGGAGTVGLVCDRLKNRNAILIDLNPEYIGMAGRRLKKDAQLKPRGFFGIRSAKV